jgi:hypothetical protein
MLTEEGIEGDVRVLVGIAWFTVRPEQHSKSGICPKCRRNVFDTHVQIQKMYLSMLVLLHYKGVGAILVAASCESYPVQFRLMLGSALPMVFLNSHIVAI